MDSQLLWGTVEMLILDLLAREPSYGYQIAQSVLSQSRGYFELKEGSLYPALHRLEKQKLLSSYWQQPEGGRRRKYYRLTDEGLRELAKRRREWERFAGAVQSVLGADHAVA